MSGIKELQLCSGMRPGRGSCSCVAGCGPPVEVAFFHIVKKLASEAEFLEYQAKAPHGVEALRLSGRTPWWVYDDSKCRQFSTKAVGTGFTGTIRPRPDPAVSAAPVVPACRY